MNIKDTVVLDDNNEYVIISKVTYEGKEYYYLVDINNHENIIFCYKDKDELIEIENKDTTEKLLPLFLEAGKSILDEE